MVLKVSQVAFEKCQKCCNYSNFVHRGHLLEVHFFIFSKTIFQDISMVKVSLKFSLFTAFFKQNVQIVNCLLIFNNKD